MEVHKNPSWKNNRGRHKFASKQLAKVRKHTLSRTDISEIERKRKLSLLPKCKKLIVEIIKFPTPTELPIQKLNIDFIIDFIKIVPGYEEAAEILKNGAKIHIPEKLL